MNQSILDETVATIIQWTRQYAEGTRAPRVNIRLDLGTSKEIYSRVRELLEPTSSTDLAYVVRSSADSEAVLLRNARPSGVGPDARVCYLLFWTPSVSGHANNAASLADLRLVSDLALLSNSAKFILPSEQAILAQCDEASAAWTESGREGARQHLRCAFEALRACLREGRGGRERSTPFVRNLESYLTSTLSNHAA
jgi:hypothetical protein